MDVFVVTSINELELTEGAGHQVYTTKYERNLVAKCRYIEKKI